MGKFAEKVAETKSTTTLCTVGRVYEALDDDEDRAAFAALFKDRAWTTIGAGLDKAPGSTAMRKHGIGNCMCPDGTALKGALFDG